jgi:hypothetical protein
MQLRTLLAVASGLAMLSVVGERSIAQNQAPFTIRFPPDGATVRETVRVRVPLASIPENGYVAYYINGQFRVALAPTAEQRASQKPGEMFEFAWDTKSPYKGVGVKEQPAPEDGEYEITAVLYAPTSASAANAIAMQTSSVRVTLANKINNDPGAITLRYNFVDGDARTYGRKGETVVVAGLTQGAAGTTDQELVSQRSELLLAVEDKYNNGRSLVRNKLLSLAVRQGGQEVVLPTQSLPNSLYQEVDPIGRVYYQNDTVSFDQFAQLGLPVSATLELPKLPVQPVRIGDTWVTENVSLDIPGTAPDKQPRVSVTSKFVGLEWENNYQVAKITQTYDSATKPLSARSIVFGNILVDSPQIKFEQDIYLAYRTGTLVKIVRKLEVTGKTTQQVSPTAGSAPGMPGGAMTGPPGMSGGAMTGPPPGLNYGAFSGMGGGMSRPPGMSGGAMTGPPPGLNYGAFSGMGGGMSRPPGMAQGGFSGGMRGGRISGGRFGGRRGAMEGGGSSMPPGMMSGGMMSGPGMPGAGMGNFGNAGQPQASQQITLRSTTTTQIKPSGRSASR